MAQINSSTDNSTISAVTSIDNPNLTSSADEFRKFIEVEVLKAIKVVAEKLGTTQEKIQAMAQLALDLIKPAMNIDELYQNAVKLDDGYSEFAPVVFVIMKAYEQKYQKKALDQVTQLIRAGAYEDAQAVVKKVLLYKAIN